MKLIHAFLPACALLLPCALIAETFEGKVTMSITSPTMKDGPQTMNFSIKEGYMRMDMESKRGPMGVITDFKNQQMLILIAPMQMYMVRPIPQPGSAPAGAQAPASHTDLQDTGVKDTILGYTCTKYTATGKEGTSEIWVTDQLGSFSGLFHGGGPGQRPQAPQAWENALQGKNFFPMRVVTSVNGSEKFKLEVTSVDKESLPDSLFSAPDGWRKFDMGAMMGGGAPGGFPGGRPTDSSN
jgi:hypothetical protein